MGLRDTLGRALRTWSDRLQYPDGGTAAAREALANAQASDAAAAAPSTELQEAAATTPTRFDLLRARAHHAWDHRGGGRDQEAAANPYTAASREAVAAYQADDAVVGDDLHAEPAWQQYVDEVQRGADQQAPRQQYAVHVKDELGYDDVVVVEADSKSEAENRAANWSPGVDIIGAYPVDETAAAPSTSGDAARREAGDDQAGDAAAAPWEYSDVANQALDALDAGDEHEAARLRDGMTPDERREMADHVFAEMGGRLHDETAEHLAGEESVTSGPKTPTEDELNGEEVDYATETAALYRYRANQYERGTVEAESALWMAETMKEYVAGLRGPDTTAKSASAADSEPAEHHHDVAGVFGGNIRTPLQRRNDSPTVPEIRAALASRAHPEPKARHLDAESRAHHELMAGHPDPDVAGYHRAELAGLLADEARWGPGLTEPPNDHYDSKGAYRGEPGTWDDDTDDAAPAEWDDDDADQDTGGGWTR